MDNPLGATQILAADQLGIGAAVKLLASGELVAIPTETVYGLAADVENDSAVEAIFVAKGRPSNQPLIVHVEGLEMARRYCLGSPEILERLAAAFWPGPLTVVVPRSQRVGNAVTGGLETVGLRSPNHPAALEVISQLGRGLAAPSANRYGHVSPTTAGHVLADLTGRIAAVLDGGPCGVGLESTIVALGRGGGPVRLLRTGGISTESLVEVLGDEPIDGTAGPLEAPGMVRSHYAPQALVEAVTGAELSDRLLAGLDETVLVITPVPIDHSRVVVMPDGNAFAAGLYGALRLGDDPAVSLVLVVLPEAGPLRSAIVDRVTKASAPRPPSD